jgi:hypothetical protein
MKSLHMLQKVKAETIVHGQSRKGRNIFNNLGITSRHHIELEEPRK